MSEPMVGSLGPADAYAVQSSTWPERAYLVVRFDGLPDDDWARHGQWQCNCPAGIRGVACRHIDAVKAKLAPWRDAPSIKPVRHLTVVAKENA